MPYMWDLESSSLEVEPRTGIWVNVIYGGCAFMRWGGGERNRVRQWTM